jgi:hypothetical protein
MLESAYYQHTQHLATLRHVLVARMGRQVLVLVLVDQGLSVVANVAGSFCACRHQIKSCVGHNRTFYEPILRCLWVQTCVDA